MNILLGIFIIILGGGIGAYLDTTKKMKAPVVFYHLGFVVGIIGSSIIVA